MVTTDVRLFVATNVLVFALASLSPWHSLARTTLEDLKRQGNVLVLSAQGVRELWVVLTRPGPLPQPLTSAQAVAALEVVVQRYPVLPEPPNITSLVCDLVRRYSVVGRQVHDANSVATMLGHGVTRLLTHNVADFRRYAALIQVLPLVKAP